MNTRLLRKIAKVIVERPKEFSMNYWHGIPSTLWPDERDGVESLCQLPKEKQISCDTTHCIAGWAQALSPHRKCKARAESDAKRLLEITPSQAKRLFYVYYWPEKFKGKKDEWKPTVKQVVARIEHFIATEGKE